MNPWKLLGLAGVVGVAAVGIAAGANSAQQHRRDFVDTDHDELRARLHQRLDLAKQRATA